MGRLADDQRNRKKLAEIKPDSMHIPSSYSLMIADNSVISGVCYMGRSISGGFAMFAFLCNCGVTRITRGARQYGIVSCGDCKGSQMAAGLARSTHGQSSSPYYKAWHGMIQRCVNPNHTKFKRYGGRGITVCDSWMKFENFAADMGEKPTGMSLGRINNDGNYEPGNCRWETPRQQLNNFSRNVVLTVHGITDTFANHCRKFGVVYWRAMYQRHKGVPPEEIFTQATPCS